MNKVERSYTIEEQINFIHEVVEKLLLDSGITGDKFIELKELILSTYFLRK